MDAAFVIADAGRSKLERTAALALPLTLPALAVALLIDFVLSRG